jgi:hypothetical protein
MVAAFVPIEMLCWLVLVESKNKYSVKQFKGMQADAKLSELLAVCEISNFLPGHFASLRDAFSGQENHTASTALVEIAGVPASGVIPPAPPPRRSRGGPHTSVGWSLG